MAVRLAIINGPNLNLLGQRDPEMYGGRKFEDYLGDLRALYPDVTIEYFQTNHEGQIIDWLHALGFAGITGIVLNAGGYAHTSVAIRDAIDAIPARVVDVHISNIYEREAFRQVNRLKDVCATSIVGQGLEGYRQAIQFLLESA